MEPTQPFSRDEMDEFRAEQIILLRSLGYSPDSAEMLVRAHRPAVIAKAWVLISTSLPYVGYCRRELMWCLRVHGGFVRWNIDDLHWFLLAMGVDLTHCGQKYTFDIIRAAHMILVHMQKFDILPEDINGSVAEPVPA